MADILERLEALLKQATTEHSHYYVAQCCRDAVHEITVLRGAVSDLSGKIVLAKFALSADKPNELARRMLQEAHVPSAAP